MARTETKQQKMIRIVAWILIFAMILTFFTILVVIIAGAGAY